MNNKQKIKKMFSFTEKERKKLKENFYCDKGQVCEYKDFKKGKFNYSILVVNTDVETNNYIVYLLIIYKQMSIPYLLLKSYNSNSKVKKYFNELCNFVENNNDDIIIEKCYNDKFINGCS